MAKNPDFAADGTDGTANGKIEDALHHIEIRNADAFQKTLVSGVSWAEKNAKLIVALLVIAILGGLGYAGLQWVGRKQERAAQEAYYAAESKFTKLKEGFERAKFKAFMPEQSKDDPKAPPAVAATGDLAKDYGTVIDDLDRIAHEFAGTTGGAQAGILAGETYLSYKQADKAIAVVQVAAQKLKPTQTLQQLSQVLWGNALAAKDDCQGAVGVWQQVLSNPSAAYLASDVSLRSGLCFEKLGQNDRALEMYRAASLASGDSSSGQAAKGFKRALELKSKPAAAPAQKNG